MIPQVQQIAKQLYLGKILYQIYYAPKQFIHRCYQEGVINLMLNAQGRQQMEQAAYHLQPLQLPAQKNSESIHFLTGKRFWYQTFFCAYSFLQKTQQNFKIVIYDDGTLTPNSIQQFQRIFPNLELKSTLEIEQRLNAHLPLNQFPKLRTLRLSYPHLRKLTDIHVGSTGWKLVLDSDMLFFQSPEFLLNWLKSPQRSCHMVDVSSAYGYSEALMNELAKVSIPACLNVGICGLKSETIDWEKLEFWCKTLVEKEGMHYYLEQALTAMLMAGESCAIAPPEQYILLPSKTEVINPKGTLHHYVAESKSWYFRYAWKHILETQKAIINRQEERKKPLML